MFRPIAHWFRRHAGSKPAAAEQTNVNRAATTAGATSALQRQRQAFERFLRLITAHLDGDERQRILPLMLEKFDAYGNASEALEDLAHPDGQKTGQWLLIQCDWKAPQELEWQVAEIAISFGMPEPWYWTETDRQARTVPSGLNEVAHWAALQSFELLHLNLGSDTYFALMLRQPEANDAMQAAQEAGLKVLTAAEFALAHV